MMAWMSPDEMVLVYSTLTKNNSRFRFTGRLLFGRTRLNPRGLAMKQVARDAFGVVVGSSHAAKPNVYTTACAVLLC